MTDAELVVTRFAPSPTGNLHIGGARTALFCWAYARRTRREGRDGRFMLRIEDTDQARSSEESTRGILRDLAWLGIDWDEGPEFRSPESGVVGGDPRGVGSFHQSERKTAGIYDRWIDEMVDRELAYPAFEKPEELEAKRKAAVAAKKQYRYDRAGLAVPRADRIARMRAGEPHVVRFRMPEAPVRVVDEVLGEVAWDESVLDDFVLRKADGYPTYHFAVVIDDEMMGVTHILRGQEHLNNTPRHVALQRALGFRTPSYAHMPLIFNMEGTKMSKRERDKAAREHCKKNGLDGDRLASLLAGTAVAQGRAALDAWLADGKSQLDHAVLNELAERLDLTLPEVSVEDFRNAGYLPGVVCNFIALLGWSPGGDVEKFDLEYLASNFDLARVGKTNARFDRVKLLAFNGDAIGAMNDAEFAAAWRPWLLEHEPALLRRVPEEHRFALLCRAVRPRAKTFRDAVKTSAFVMVTDEAVKFDESAVKKHLLANDGAGVGVLREIAAVLGALPSYEPESIAAAIDKFAKDRGLGLGLVAQPVRVGVIGSAVSPPLGDTLALLGRESVANRISRCLAEQSRR